MLFLWLLLFLALMIVEIVTGRRWAIWFAFGAVVAYVMGKLSFSLPVQIAAFLVASGVLLAMYIPKVKGQQDAVQVQEQMEGLIGQPGIVKVNIDTINQNGIVEVKGKRWPARTAEQNGWILKNTAVVVDGIAGEKLVVHAPTIEEET